jgi:hypothetical protein
MRIRSKIPQKDDIIASILKDMCLDLLIVIKHEYNWNRLFKSADHIHVGVRTYAIYKWEKVLDEKERKESTR